MNASVMFAQQIIGDGNVVQENRSVSSFDKIQVDDIINVFLKQGNTESVILESDKNLIPLIEIKVDDNKLYISTKDDAEIKKSTKMNAYVTLKDLKSLEMKGVGNVESQNELKLESLWIENSAVGNLSLELDCDKLTADINSVGSAKFSGTVKNVSIDHNGIGNIKAFDLTADVLKIQSNGVGNSEVNSNNEIYIDLNGIGNVSYKGSAVVKAMNVNGMGKVKKM
ncbi:MAG: head GIN domain-containing protein [Ignavibacteria bacterium]